MDLPVIRDGSHDDVRSYLAGRLGTEAFHVSDGFVELELPLAGNGSVSSSRTGIARFPLFDRSNSLALEPGGLVHALPDGWETTLCSIPLPATSKGRDDLEEVSCRWCLIRLLAIEVAVPRGPLGARRERARPTSVRRASSGRSKTDLYVEAVDAAVAHPGTWIRVGRVFDTQFNASKTASCLKGGYLTIVPKPGEASIRVRDKVFLKTSAPVTCRTAEITDGWTLEVRFEGSP